jgi:nucleoside-diphosphate-sugar epimerase
LGTPSHVKTAIVCPCTIYGQGTGPANQRSAQVPNLTLETLKRGKGFTVNGGKNTWNQVHIRDLARLYLKLTEAAAAGGEGADWNEEGYYFAENGEFRWGEIAKLIAKKAHAKGLIKTDEVDDLSNEEVAKILAFGPIIWGTNSRGKAQRARERLGWNPVEPSLEETLDHAIEVEAKALGLL